MRGESVWHDSCMHLDQLLHPLVCALHGALEVVVDAVQNGALHTGDRSLPTPPLRAGTVGTHLIDDQRSQLLENTRQLLDRPR